MVKLIHIGCRNSTECVTWHLITCQDCKQVQSILRYGTTTFSVCAPQVETQRDHSLRRRIQSLQCFLFEQLHKELNQAQSQPQPQPSPAKGPMQAANSPLPTTSEPATSLSQTALPALPPLQATTAAVVESSAPTNQSMSSSSGQSITDHPSTAASPAATDSEATASPASAAAAATASASEAVAAAADSATGATAATSPVAAASATASEAAATTALDAAGQGEAADGQQDPRGQAALQDAAVEGISRKTVIDDTFGIVVKQRTKVLTGVQADKFRESRSFQVHTASPCLFIHLLTFAC